MANPQPDIFTKLSKEYHEALCKIRIPGQARQVLDFIILKTWGYRKKEDWIGLGQFEKGTGLTKTHVCRAINKLLDMKLIIKKDNSITQKGNAWGATYSIQKNYEEWKPLPKKITLPKKIMPITNKDNTITQKDNRSLPKKVPTIDKLTLDNDTIDNITTDIKSENKFSDDDGRVEVIPYFHIIDDLNKKAGTHYRYNTKFNKGLIKSLWKQGFGLEDFFKVHDTKIKDWIHNPKMCKYIRPKTLYAPSNFEGYLNEIPPNYSYSEITIHNLRASQEWLKEMEEKNEE